MRCACKTWHKTVAASTKRDKEMMEWSKNAMRLETLAITLWNPCNLSRPLFVQIIWNLLHFLLPNLKQLCLQWVWAVIWCMLWRSGCPARRRRTFGSFPASFRKWRQFDVYWGGKSSLLQKKGSYGRRNARPHWRTPCCGRRLTFLKTCIVLLQKSHWDSCSVL